MAEIPCDANLAALELTLTDEHVATLDEVSAQLQPFPHDFLANVQAVIQNGTTVNGEHREIWPMAPQNDAERH